MGRQRFTSAVLWKSAVWWLAVVLASLHAAVTSWFVRSFYLFGAGPERGDHLVGAGACVAAALVLLVGACTAVRAGRGRWAGTNAARVVVVLALLVAAGAVDHLVEAREDPVLSDDEVEPLWSTFGWGLAQVLVMPWSWVLLVAGLPGLVARRR